MYLLFINFNNGLKHNAVYTNLKALKEGIEQLIDDEGMERRRNTLKLSELENHFLSDDDFFRLLPNGTWFHIQELNSKNFIG
ncbi:MAG: hypothetical protein N2510_09500 [Ignavibacteria bacterium]|nr:hypothetical protein [Ignavibacteria bacterium]